MKTSPLLYSIFSKVRSKNKIDNPTAKQYLRFNWVFLFFASVPLLSVALLNVAIDPYDVFKSPDFLGLNHSKIKKDNNDRLYKATDIIRIKPITVLIGSSRTKQGLDPTHPALKKYQPVYNLALNGPNFYEQLRYLQHAIANQKNLKEVVLGVDFFMFNSSLMNQPTFSEERLEKRSISLQDVINSTLSLDVFSTSLQTVDASLQEPNKNDNYGENGFMPNLKLKGNETEWRFTSGINLYFKLHSSYQLSDKYMSDFKHFVELCHQRGIQLKIFISPSHATQWEAIRATGRWQTFEQWKREIVKIAPVWDFSGYNSITTEPLSSQMKNYADNSHYTKKIGDLVLNRIFSYRQDTVPKDFGILVTSENIETHLAKIRQDRESWAKRQPDEVKLVKDLFKKGDYREMKVNQ